MKIHCQQLQWIHLCQKFSQIYLPLCQYTFQISKKFSLMLEASSWIIQFKDTKDANCKIAGLIQLWCTSIFEFNKALTKTFDRIVLGTVLMVRCSYSTAAATTLALVMQQIQHCTSYAVAIALHQAPIRDFIIATTQINIYIYIYIYSSSKPIAHQYTILPSKRYYSTNLHKLFVKKVQSSIKDKKNSDHYKL